MPGSPARLALTLLLCQLPGPAAAGVRKELVGALGGAVTFPVTHSVNQIESIVWTFNITPLVTIQPNMADQDNVIVIQNHNKDRVSFPQGNYSLKLSKLTESDAGTYRVTMYSPSPPGSFSQEYGLRVYEHLAKPKVTVGLQDSKNGTCATNLTCVTEQGGEGVTYSWESWGQATNKSHDGSVFPVSWRLGDKDTTFICTVRNPVSSNTSNPVYAGKLCAGATGPLESSTVLLTLLWVILLLTVLVFLPIILFMWRERGKEATKEKKGVDARQDVPHCPAHCGEASVYATVPDLHTTIPEENSLNTLYFTVQIPEKVGCARARLLLSCRLTASPGSRFAQAAWAPGTPCSPGVTGHPLPAVRVPRGQRG